MNKLIRKGQVQYDFLRGPYRGQIQRQNRRRGLGLGEGKEGSGQWGRVSSWEEQVLEMPGGGMYMNVLNATELYTSKWLKW